MSKTSTRKPNKSSKSKAQTSKARIQKYETKTQNSKPTAQTNTVKTQNTRSRTRNNLAQHRNLNPALLLCGIITTLAIASAVYALARGYAHARVIAQLQEISNCNSGNTYEEVVANIQANMPNYEIIFVFDQNGKKLVEYTNENPHGVSLPNEAIVLLHNNFHHLTHAHNHPLYDSPYSDSDIAMPTRIGLEENIDNLVVIGANHTYSLECSELRWPTIKQFYDYSSILRIHYGNFTKAGFMKTTTINGEEYPYMTTKFYEILADDFDYTFTITTKE